MDTNPFVWDHDYKNTEQLRPYLADFLAVLNEDDTYKYNADFKGRIPGLANSANEDTGIYLLRKLLDLDRLKERTTAFLNAGGYRISDRTPGPTKRGTLVHTGFYMGGTGWSEAHHAIVTLAEDGNIRFKLPRQRNWRTHYSGPSAYLFKEDQS